LPKLEIGIPTWINWKKGDDADWNWNEERLSLPPPRHVMYQNNNEKNNKIQAVLHTKKQTPPPEVEFTES